MPDKTETGRWREEKSYKKDWIARSERLMYLFLDREDQGKQWSFAEFGCGPYAPFSELARGKDNFSVNRYDIKQWDGGVRLSDLNSPSAEMGTEDVCVLSGVCEYLNSVEDSLRQLGEAYDKFLVSYSYMPDPSRFTTTTHNIDVCRLQSLKRRAVEAGWRNHHTLAEFTHILSRVGYICDVNQWRSQALFFVRRY